MKKAVLLLAGLLTVLSMSFASAQFSDVPAGHWAKEAVEALAAEGIILGFPDGTFRGNENLTRYQAAMIIYRLLQKLEPGQMANMDQETITALRNAVQELAAELASLGVRVSALEDNAATKSDVARLEKMIAELQGMPAGGGASSAAVKDLADRVEAAAIAADTALAQVQALSGKVDAIDAQASANADSIKALNELAVMLNQDVLSLQDRVTALEKASGMTDLTGIATKGDVQSVRDYVTAIRGDLVNVSNKVSALEANVDDLGERVGNLEATKFSVSGFLQLNYKSQRLVGDAFDLDRLFMDSAFSSGDAEEGSIWWESAGVGQVVDDEDIDGDIPGDTSALWRTDLHYGKYDAQSAHGYNGYPEFTDFRIRLQGSGSFVYDPITGAPTFTPSLHILDASTNLLVADGQNLRFKIGTSNKVKFTEYVFDNDALGRGPGVIGMFDAGFLNLTGVYGNYNTSAYDYYYAGRAVVKPFNGFALAGSYAKQDGLGTIYGADLNAQLGPLSVVGEYFSSDVTANADGMYVIGKAKFGAFGAEFNWRNIGAGVNAQSMFSRDAEVVTRFTSPSPVDYAAGNYHPFTNAPFSADQQGMGGKLSAQFGLVGIDGYFDQYSIASNNYQAFGGTLSLGVDESDKDGRKPTRLAGFRVEGHYLNATDGGTVQDSIQAPWSWDTYDSKMGASVAHFGDAPDAIVKGLDLYAGYDRWAGSGNNEIEAYAKHKGKFGILNDTLLIRYHTDGTDTTVKYGGKIETDPLGIVLAPSFSVQYIARSTTGGSPASETKMGAGIKFNKFLFKNSVFGAEYAKYTTSNVDILLGSQDKAWDPTRDFLYGTSGTGGNLQGIYLTWDYWDLQFAYTRVWNASFGSPRGEAFQAKYIVKW